MAISQQAYLGTFQSRALHMHSCMQQGRGCCYTCLLHMHARWWILPACNTESMCMCVPVQNRYHMARSFVPPGRLLFLRPMKSATRETSSKRKYEAVWIEVEVGSDLCRYAKGC